MVKTGIKTSLSIGVFLSMIFAMADGGGIWKLATAILFCMLLGRLVVICKKKV